MKERIVAFPFGDVYHGLSRTVNLAVIGLPAGRSPNAIYFRPGGGRS
ncbi:hypothetical protein ACFL2H_09150 [Planctomycetota bacterium]